MPFADTSTGARLFYDEALPDNDYEWRVRSSNDHGTSSWSSYLDFTVDDLARGFRKVAEMLEGRRGQFEVYAGAGIPLAPDDFKATFIVE